MNARIGRGVFTGLLLVGLAAAAGCKSQGEPLLPETGKETESMEATYTVETTKSVEQVRQDLEAACKRHEFGVMGTYDLQEKMREKGVDFERECLIVEICNPQRAKQVLSWEMKVSTALPCRVSIYRIGDKTYLSTLPPLRLIELFEAKALEPIAKTVQDQIFTIMAEAAATGKKGS